jgi:hypothetical protein
MVEVTLSVVVLAANVVLVTTSVSPSGVQASSNTRRPTDPQRLIGPLCRPALIHTLSSSHCCRPPTPA